MDNKKNIKKKNEMEISKENEDFQNIPESSSHKEPPIIDKKDIKKASELNEDGKTDNTKKH
ncbi:MAG: hypothetical protein H7195_03795 [Chryseobacterium sp.]|nr:hypothetical protein [Chryseobacterium sp.]